MWKDINKSEYISISEFICEHLKLLQDIADDVVDSSILNNKLQQYRMVVENDNKRDILFETARINICEADNGLFPYNKWELKV